MQRANLPTAAIPDGETEQSQDECSLLTHNMLLTTSPDMVVVRLFSKGEAAAHIGTTPERAIKIGEALIRAALRIKPSLRLPGEPLKAVESQPQ